MGYTHYFDFNRKPADIENGDKKFKEAVELFKEKLAKLPPVRLRGGSGKGEPVMTDKVLCFNGDASKGEDYETMYISYEDEDAGYNFCKTARQPYDAAVCLALLCFNKVFGDDFTYSSDGYCPRSSAVINGEEELEEGWKPAFDAMQD